MPVPRNFAQKIFWCRELSPGLGVLIKLGRGCGIKAEVFEVYLKTKKMTDISQTQAGCKAKSLRATPHNPAVLVEIDDSFDFSDTP